MLVIKRLSRPSVGILGRDRGDRCLGSHRPARGPADDAGSRRRPRRRAALLREHRRREGPAVRTGSLGPGPAGRRARPFRQLRPRRRDARHAGGARARARRARESSCASPRRARRCSGCSAVRVSPSTWRRRSTRPPPAEGEARSPRLSQVLVAGDRSPRPRRLRHAEAVPGQDRARHPRLDARLGSLPPGQGAGGRAERARRPLRRHRPCGLVAVRRADRDADAATTRRQRADVFAVAHDGALLADPIGLPDRAQSPSERVRDHLRDVDRLSGLQLPHSARVRDDGDGPPRRRLEHVLGREEPQHAGRRVDDGLVEEGLAARPGLRPLLRLPRRRDEQLVSRPRRGQPLRRPAVRPRGRLPPLEGPRRQGASVHPRLEAVGAGQALVPLVLPGREPRAAPLRRRSTSTSTRASSTTATRPTASGCCRG